MEDRSSAPAFELSWLTAELALGGRFAPCDVGCLRARHGISHVVDLRSEHHDDPELLREHGLELLHLPTLDHGAVTPEMLDLGVAWIMRHTRGGGRVYVHCEHGIGRSVLLAWCVLVARGERVRDALVRIKHVRPCASPSPKQIEALLTFAARYAPALPSWNELADIAYAHVPGRVPSGTAGP